MAPPRTSPSLQELLDRAAEMADLQKLYLKEAGEIDHSIQENTSKLKALDHEYGMEQIISMNRYLRYFMAELLRTKPQAKDVFAEHIQRYERCIRHANRFVSEKVQYAQQHAPQEQHQYTLTLQKLAALHLKAEKETENTDPKEKIQLHALVTLLNNANQIYWFDTEIKEAKHISISTIPQNDPEQNLAILFPIIIRLLKAYNAFFIHADEAAKRAESLKAAIEKGHEQLKLANEYYQLVSQCLAETRIELARTGNAADATKDDAYLHRKQLPDALQHIEDPKKKMIEDFIAHILALKIQGIMADISLQSLYSWIENMIIQRATMIDRDLKNMAHQFSPQFPNALPAPQKLQENISVINLMLRVYFKKVNLLPPPPEDNSIFIKKYPPLKRQ